jgi:hypothetical protein
MPIFRGKPDSHQRHAHWEQSTSVSEFLKHSRGKTLQQLANETQRIEQLGNYTSRQPNGPRGHRYVRDPLDPSQNGQPGGVIDMAHFMNAALVPIGLGEWAGALVEEKQKWIDKFPSGRFEEDYKSNFLGVVFRNNYWRRDNDISDEFQRFFSDYGNGTLRGFIPAVERAIEQIKQQGAGGLRQLQQLRELFEDYRQRLQSFQPQAEWQNLDRQFIAAEQALGNLAGTPQPSRPNFSQQASPLSIPRQLLQAHTAVKEMRRWEPWLPKMKNAEQLAATYREQRQEYQRLQQAEQQAQQALAPLEAKGPRSLLNPWGAPAQQLASAHQQVERATINRQNYERDFRYTEGRVQEYMQMAKDHEQWQQTPQTQALIALEQQLQQPELAQQLQQAQHISQLFNQGLSAAESLGRSPAYQHALDQAQTAYLETGELPSEAMVNAMQQDLMLHQQVAQQAELGGLELG